MIFIASARPRCGMGLGAAWASVRHVSGKVLEIAREHKVKYIVFGTTCEFELLHFKLTGTNSFANY